MDEEYKHDIPYIILMGLSNILLTTPTDKKIFDSLHW